MKPDDSRTVYDGKLFDVTVERWGEHEREIVEHPGAVAVVAVDREGLVTLVRQRREAARKALVELPAGHARGGRGAGRRRRAASSPRRPACTAATWREVAAFWTTPGFCRERMHLFFAEGVEPGEARPEDDEELELVRWPVAELEQRLDEIEDAKTLAGLLLFLRERG